MMRHPRHILQIRRISFIEMKLGKVDAAVIVDIVGTDIREVAELCAVFVVDIDTQAACRGYGIVYYVFLSINRMKLRIGITIMIFPPKEVCKV